MKLPAEYLVSSDIMKSTERPVDYSEYMWMGEEMEEFDRMCIEQLLEEEFIETCFDELYEEEEEAYHMLMECLTHEEEFDLDQLSNALDQLSVNGNSVLSSEELKDIVHNSRLSPDDVRCVSRRSQDPPPLPANADEDR